MAQNAWSHLAVVANGEKITIYLEGEPYATLSAPLPALDGPVTVRWQDQVDPGSG